MDADAVCAELDRLAPLARSAVTGAVEKGLDRAYDLEILAQELEMLSESIRGAAWPVEMIETHEFEGAGSLPHIELLLDRLHTDPSQDDVDELVAISRGPLRDFRRNMMRIAESREPDGTGAT